MNNPEKKDFYLVFFIENHISTSSPEISLCEDGEDLFGDLKKIKSEQCSENKSKEKEKFNYALYNFKIYPEKIKEKDKDKVNIKIELENENEKFFYETVITDFDKDNYVYNLKFKEKGKPNKDKLPKSLNLTSLEQYEIFRDYLLKDLKKKKNDKQVENLIISTQQLFKEKYEFNFYMIVFMDSASPLLKIKHISYFDRQNIKGNGDMEKYKKICISLLKAFKNDPEKILKEIKNEKEKEQSGIKLFGIILYFYHEYIKNEFEETIENKNEKAKYYINNALLNYNSFFQDVKLTKERVQELINISKTFDQFFVSLKYLNIGLNELLNFIDSDFEKFKEIFLVEKKEGKNPKINIGAIIEAKENDNLKDICEKYEELVEKQKKEMGIHSPSIFISGAIFDKYISFFEGNNLDNLFIIKNIIEKLDIKDIKNNINKSILEYALLLGEKAELKNLQIFDLIQNITKEKKDKEIKNAIELLPLLNIDEFDSKCFDEWKKIKWNEILKKNDNLYSLLTEKVIGLIKDLKHFDILFKLLNVSTKPDKIEIKPSSLELMRNKFIEIFRNYDFNALKDIDFKKDIISLIIYSKQEKKDENGILFLNKLKDVLNEVTINDIFLSLISEYGTSLHGDIINHIIEFYTKDRELNSEQLLSIIINSPDNIKKNIIFDRLGTFKPNEEDLLAVKESEKYKLFKGLLDNRIFQNDKFKSKFYITEVNKLIKDIQKILESGEGKIEWSKIYSFYSESENIEEKEKKEKAFNEKLLKIFLNNEEKASNIKSRYDEYIITTKKKLESLSIILEDFLGFFKETQKENIEKVKEYIKEMSTGPINFYEKNKNNIEKFIDNYEQDARKRNEKNKSSLFCNIYKYTKRKFIKEKEQMWLEEANKAFEKLKIIFNDNGLKSLKNENYFLFTKCLETLKGKNMEQILDEINILIKLFNVEIVESQKKEIVNSLLVLSKKDDVINVAEAISSFIIYAGLSQGNLCKLVGDIIQNKDNLDDDKILSEYINDLKKNNIDIDILYKKEEKFDNYINILLALKKVPESITFLINFRLDDCRALQEAAADNDDGLLNAGDIKDFEECVKFKDNLGNAENLKNMKDFDFFEKFQKEVKYSPNIEIYFIKYVKIYKDLNELYQKRFEKSEASKYKILAICENSKFKFKNKKKHFFRGFYCGKEKKEFKLKLTTLKELRDRAQLTKKMSNDEDEIQLLNKYKDFIKKVSDICRIHELVKEIYSSGYIKDIEISVTIEKFTGHFKGVNIDTTNSEELITKLKKILDDFKKEQNAAYRDRELIRYIYGRQINLIYDKIYNKEENKKNNKDVDILPLLKFITNNAEIKDVNIDFKADKNKDKDIYKTIDNYLAIILQENNITRENIHSHNKIEKKEGEPEYNGLYTFKAENLQINVLQLYKYFTKSIPNAQYILFCNKETSNEELTAFLYRAILCKTKSCFIIAGVELLSFKQKTTLLYLLDELYVKNIDEKNKMKSCLFIVFTDIDADIMKSIFLLKGRKSLMNILKQLEDQKMDGINENIKIIRSDKSGVGKSTHIKLEIEKSGREYVYFPFGGVFTRQDILNRLKNLKDLKNATLHLDLNDTEQIDLTMEFLFSILITKIYGQNEDIFYLPKDVPIMVEIPNGFVNFMKKFPLLNIFKNEYLKLKNLAPLIEEKKIDSNVQVVANYLKLLKENEDALNKNDIIFEGISPKGWSLRPDTIKAKILSQKECQEFIFEKIKERIKTPNYYQITSFINLLGTLLKKLSKVVILSPNCWNEFFRRNIGKLRSLVINNYIKFVKYFTESGFIDLINSNTNYDTDGKFDEDKSNEKAIKKLAEIGEGRTDLITFDKLNTSLMIFGEKEDEVYSVITNNPNEEEKQYYLGLLNLQTTPKGEQIPLPELNAPIKDPNDKEEIKKRQKLFLEQLKNILAINNEVDAVDNKKDDNKKDDNKKDDNKKDDNKKDENKKDDIDFEEEEEDDDNNDDEKEKVLEKEEEGKTKKTLLEIADDYVFTADNFFKMVLILLRIRANIPVIMMGETGCGKTALIRKLSELLNNGSKNKMKILNIHAGTNDKDIIDFLERKVIPKAERLQNKETEEQKKRESQGFLYTGSKLWVFLDEINTCKSMGLISEILCKRTYQGKKLPSNIAFIAACNPYRYDEKKIKNKFGLNIKEAQKEINENIKDVKEKYKIENASSKESLIYTVNPLPYSLLNFVFNFGNIAPNDEKEYIRNIITKSQENYFNMYKKEENLNDDDFKNIHKLAVDLIVESQNFIRKNNDKSSVSLREIKRFNIFFEFFFDYLKMKKEKKLQVIEGMQSSEEEPIDYINLKYKDIHIYSIIMSIFVCYYLRIPDNKTREELDKKLSKILSVNDKNFTKFLELPQKEEMFIAQNIELEKGIAKNRALLDNLFALFVTINTKVPIFIVGKPGCSKSLSVQLINKAMKGKTSDNLLFENLPRIIMTCYQGSMGSTSEGVKNVFKKARKVLKNFQERKEKNELNKEEKNEIKDENEKEEKIISMIFFDEMGLAEHSPNNPLKVIHSELEYDLNEDDKKVAFVGISNWALDASKMNRGLYLSIPDPDRQDAKDTSYTIGESYDYELASNFKTLYENIGEIYLDYKNYLNIEFSNGFEEFHGNRDFYHFVKNVGNNILIENKKDLNKNKKNAFISEGIERNFAGLKIEKKNETSLKRMKIYCNDYNIELEKDDKYRVVQRISENIKDNKSRYLLVISKPSITEFLLSSILKQNNKEYNYYKGSPFTDDKKSEEYILKILNKVQLNMEQDKVLILNNLGTVYPALYDLFNQNFTQVGKKNYARIALGYTTNTYSFVNENFRCIVNVDEDKIKKEEPPFLNRFEKHIISFENLLDESEINKSNEIYNNLLEITEKDEQSESLEGIDYYLKDIFINLDKEEINGYIYKLKKDNVRFEDLKEKIIEKLSLILPQDIILFMKYSGFNSKYPDDSELILKGYKEGEHININRFLKKMNYLKNVIYTFSDIFKADKIKEFKNVMLGVVNSDNITDIKISSFTSENKFEDAINEFMSNKNKKLCLIKFSSEERHFLNYAKFLIENKEKEITNNENDNEELKKAFIFIVYLERKFYDNNSNTGVTTYNEENEERNKYDETISLTSEFYQIFIDDLYGEENYTLDDVLNFKGKELFKKAIGNDRIDKDILESLKLMDYSMPYEYKEINQKNYVNMINDLIRSDTDIKIKINDIIYKEMETDEQILINAFKKKGFVSNHDIDILSSLRRYLSEIYSHVLNNFYYRAEKDQFFSTLLSLKKQKEKDRNKNININVIKNEDNDENENDNNIIENNDKNEEEKNNEENEFKKNVIKEAIQLYLNEFKFEKEAEDQNDKKEEDKKNNQNKNIIENMGANKINIILGLQLPGMFKMISDIIKKTRNEVLKRYGTNESLLRKYIEDEEITNAKTEYEKILKILDENIKIDLIKNNKINNLITLGQNEKHELIDSILEDYYTIFINNNLSKYIISLYEKKKNYSFDLSELKNILKFVVANQNESIINNNIDFDTIASVINWVEFYSTEITYILKIYLMFKDNIENINGKIKYIVDNEVIEYENSERCKEYTSKVNKALFLGFESLLKIITSYEQLYLYFLEVNQISELINRNEEIFNQINKFNINLKLYSKELLSLKEIIVIINELNSKKICNSDNLKKVLKYFSETIKDRDKLIENFESFFKDLEEMLGKKKDKNYYKMISTVFKNEFMKHFYNEEFKNKIIEIIITNKDNEYIASNYPLLSMILEFDITPSKIKESFVKIKEDKNLLQIIDKNCQNEFLEQYILNIYDYLFMLYFSKTPGNIEASIKNNINEDDIKMFIKLTNDLKKKIEKKGKKEFNTGIILDLSLEIFGECINFLNDINSQKDENKNLAKLYSISYIKSYLNKLVNFSLNSFQELGSIKDIIKILESKENGLMKVIKLYIIKIFFNSEKVKKDFNELNKINFKDLDYNFIFQMICEENKENKVFKEIIEEKESPNIEKYKDYTFLKYFTYSINKESELNLFKKQVKKEKDYKNKYPCIYLYQCEAESNDKKLKVMKYLERYNEFCDLMIDNYSFKITREEAQKQKLKSQKIYKTLTEEDNKNKKNKQNNIFSDFFEIWKNIKDKAIEYQSNKLPIKELNDNDYLAYFLNDIYEVNYGMYIAAGYQYFIKLQNDFLNYIIEHGKDKPYLKLYFENMENKIPVYEANNNQILLLYQIYNTSEYKNLGEIVNTFTKRKIYNEDGSINYLKYNEFEFDFQSIEEELAKLILPGKCLFEDATNLNFVNYWGEGFNGGKSDFLQRFEESYKTEELSDEEKSKIYEYLKENYNDQNEYKQIYGSIQLLIFYLINNNFNEEDTIINIIEKSKDYLKIDDENFKGIFNANGMELKAKKIIDIFLFIEHLCFDIFGQNIMKEYKVVIDDNNKNKINDNKNKYENIKELAAAVRRFISRLLYTIKNKDDLSPEGKLEIQLKRLDLWDKKYRNVETIQKIIMQISEYDLTVGQSFEFYQLIKSEAESKKTTKKKLKN